MSDSREEKNITVRAAAEYRRKVRAKAAAEGISLQGLTIGLLNRWMEGEEPTPHPFEDAIPEELRYAQITIAVLHSGSDSSAAMLRAILDAWDSMRKHGAG